MAQSNKTPNSNVDPAFRLAAVTPNDVTSLIVDSMPPRGLWVGTGGHVSVVGVDGVTALLKNVASGTLVPVRASKVNGTGTTASDIVALY